MSLLAILAAAEPLDDGLKLSIPADWHQGRTAYGGLSAMLAYAAACHADSDLPPLRSATISFVGPLSGEVRASTRTLRKGRNATWVSVEVAGEGGQSGGAQSSIGLTASFVFMSPIESEVRVDNCPPPPSLIPPEQGIEVPDRNRPAFLNHCEARYALPRSTERRPEIAWWVRLRDRDGLDPVAEVLAVADALPAGVLPLFGKPVNISSMTWIVNLLTSTPRTRDGWWLLRTASDYADAGCVSDDMRLWNADGEPVALGMQSVAVFG